MERKMHHGHEKNAGRKADDYPLLFLGEVLLPKLLFSFCCLFRLLSGNSQELVPGVDDGLLHLLQADHAGIIGDIGLFRRQVHPGLHHAIQVAQGCFYSPDAHGTGHSSYLQDGLLVDHLVAQIANHALDINELQLPGIILHCGALTSQIDLDPGDSIQVQEGLLDG